MIEETTAVTVRGIDLGHLLNALIQLRWTVEDAAPANESEMLQAIGRVESTLLTNEGRLSHTQRDSFLMALRMPDAMSAESYEDLLKRIERMLN